MKDNFENKVEFFVSEKTSEDAVINLTSPQTFAEYLGQTAVKNKIKLYVEAAKKRGDVLDHVLLYGSPGLGKTTFAKIIANELGCGFKMTSAPALEKTGDLVAILSSLQEKEVLFIDEIHRLNKQIEETLYSAMESFFVDIIVGQGAGARVMQLPINKFTLIGATTRTGALSGPLQTRFGIVERLEFYEPDELGLIIEQNAKKINLEINVDAALEIGKRSRGTPRIAKRILRRIRDFAEMNGQGVVSLEVAKKGLDFLNINALGLDVLDQKLLKVLEETFHGGPVGLETLAAATGEDKQTIEEYCEPYLIRQGFLQKTPRGRKLANNFGFKNLSIGLIGE